MQGLVTVTDGVLEAWLDRLFARNGPGAVEQDDVGQLPVPTCPACLLKIRLKTFR
mgnify:CR=1 FL=1